MIALERPPRCLVLGGTGHVGRAVCRRLAEDGVEVAFTYRASAEAAKDLAADLGARAIRADLGNFAGARGAVEEAARAWDGIDALVQCAGTAGDPALYRCAGPSNYDKFLDITEDGFDEMLDVTVKGTFAACQEASRWMRKRGSGRIVLIGSMDGVKPLPSPIHYAAGKGALGAMTWALAKELGNFGILVNQVAPGILDGGISRLLSEALRSDYLRHCSLGRVGTSGDVAEVVAWLVTENTYVTGQTILLDGGL